MIHGFLLVIHTTCVRKAPVGTRENSIGRPAPLWRGAVLGPPHRDLGPSPEFRRGKISLKKEIKFVKHSVYSGRLESSQLELCYVFKFA